MFTVETCLWVVLVSQAASELNAEENPVKVMQTVGMFSGITSRSVITRHKRQQ